MCLIFFLGKINEKLYLCRRGSVPVFMAWEVLVIEKHHRKCTNSFSFFRSHQYGPYKKRKSHQCGPYNMRLSVHSHMTIGFNWKEVSICNIHLSYLFVCKHLDLVPATCHIYLHVHFMYMYIFMHTNATFINMSVLLPQSMIVHKKLESFCM